MAHYLTIQLKTENTVQCSVADQFFGNYKDFLRKSQIESNSKRAQDRFNLSILGDSWHHLKLLTEGFRNVVFSFDQKSSEVVCIDCFAQLMSEEKRRFYTDPLKQRLLPND